MVNDYMKAIRINSSLPETHMCQLKLKDIRPLQE